LTVGVIRVQKGTILDAIVKDIKNGQLKVVVDMNGQLHVPPGPVSPTPSLNRTNVPPSGSAPGY
jgi:hypothetical protein